MRCVLLVSLVVILSVPITAGIPDPIIPAMTMTLSPVSMNMTTKENDVNVTFNGTVQVDKLPLERIVVALTSSVDTGWASACSPSSFVITDKSVHKFTVTVTVPVCVTASAIVTADGKGQGGGFICVAQAESQLSVLSLVEKLNGTANPSKPPGSTDSSKGGPLFGGPNWQVPVALAIGLGAGGTAGLVYYIKDKRRKAARR